jgi:hypothetical protein
MRDTGVTSISVVNSRYQLLLFTYFMNFNSSVNYVQLCIEFKISSNESTLLYTEMSFWAVVACSVKNSSREDSVGTGNGQGSEYGIC